MSDCLFKPKTYGYGATPLTWQGRAVTLGALAVCLSAALQTMALKNLWSIGTLLAVYAAAIGALFVVGYRKTDHEWRWRWDPGRSGKAN